MADTTTPTYSFTLPEIGASEDTWGTKLNANWTALDGRLGGANPIAPDLVGWKVGGVAVSVSAAQINSVTAKADAANPSFTGAITEQLFTVTDGPAVTLNPANGTLQTWTLGANRTPALTMSDGQFLLLRISDGAGFTVTWTTAAVTWLNGVTPTLSTTGFTFIQLFKVGGVVYGSSPGIAA